MLKKLFLTTVLTCTANASTPLETPETPLETATRAVRLYTDYCMYPIAKDDKKSKIQQIFHKEKTSFLIGSNIDVSGIFISFGPIMHQSKELPEVTKCNVSVSKVKDSLLTKALISNAWSDFSATKSETDKEYTVYLSDFESGFGSMVAIKQYPAITTFSLELGL